MTRDLEPTGSRVLWVGLAVMDQIFAVDRMPASPSKHFATGFREIGGGPAANASVAAVRLGGAVRLWSRVGNDPMGGRIVRGLDEEGVDTSGVRRAAGARSSCSVVIVDALGFACAAAALKCTRPGGRAGAPTAVDLEAFLEEHA
jgi:sulfofructose kinase